MASTGEVGCLGDDFNEAILKSILSVGYRIPKKNILISSGDALNKADLLDACKTLQENGYSLFATGGSYKYLISNGVQAQRVLWPSEDKDPELAGTLPSALKMIQDKEIDLEINIPKNYTSQELQNGYLLRRAAVDFNIPLITNVRLATAFIKAFCELPMDEIQIKSWDQY